MPRRRNEALARLLPESCRPGFEKLSEEDQDAAWARDYEKFRRLTIQLARERKRSGSDQDLVARVDRLERLVLILLARLEPGGDAPSSREEAVQVLREMMQ